MADLDMEKQGYSGFERFMFFVTPVLFTLVLLGVLLTIFNFDLRNKLLTIGHSIPFLEQVLPDPVVKDSDLSDTELTNKHQATKIEQLTTQLSEKEAELKQAVAEQKKQTEQVKDLQGQIDQLQRIQTEKQMDDEQYQANINELANMYAKITPSKAAPILQSMELEEAVLVLSAMRPDDRVRIMEKMSPKKAADATIMLKDNVTAKDRQIAALQAQLKKQNKPSTEPTSTLDATQLKETFSKMNAKNAGELLLKMSEVSPSKALRILNAVDSTARSAILAEMSDQNKGVTAQLVSKLMTGK
ncbi:magnesium transporter MgtE N-terminal domain-containing protein [Paenibacillus sp. GCM10027626]|uniref:magnesium transporter MgtE N-terminal domain-containing protein n=1 Tax=Paenibacillus sp. GCM10027626 TaxID=3273411 RepID=UPI003629485D